VDKLAIKGGGAVERLADAVTERRAATGQAGHAALTRLPVADRAVDQHLGETGIL